MMAAVAVVLLSCPIPECGPMSRPRSADQAEASSATCAGQKTASLSDTGSGPVISVVNCGQQQQQQDNKRRSACVLDETPEPVIIAAGQGGPAGVESSPKRKPVGGVALISAQALNAGTSRSIGSPVQRSKSMKMEIGDGSLGLRPVGLRPVSQASCDRSELDVDLRSDGKTPLSAQNSPIKRGLNSSSDFFQRSKSFSAKVSETHQALGNHLI